MKDFFQTLRRWLGRPRLVKQTRAVIIDDENACEDPIFLIGCHRSGTSLVRRIFNSHRDIACPPETYFLKHYVEMASSDRVSNGFLGFGYDRDAMRLELRRQARRMHEGFRLAEAKRRWADKTPQYVGILGGLRDLFGPGARFVMIYRHPYDVAASIYEKGWRFLNEEDDLFEDTLKYVAKAQRTQREFEAGNPKRCTRLFYENLNKDPKGELSRVLKFLDEEFDPQMVAFDTMAHNFGIEDLIVRSAKGFQFSQGKWQSWKPEQLEKARDILEGPAKALGYEIPELTVTVGRG